MWLWRHSAAQPSRALWLKLIVLVFVGHVLVVGHLLFWYADHGLYHISVQKSLMTNNAPIIFMPLYKRAPQVPSASKSAAAKSSKVVPKQGASAKKESSSPVVQKKTSPVAKKTPKAPKPVAPKQASQLTAEAPTKKNAVTAPVPKEVAKQPEIPKPVTQKKETPQPVIPAVPPQQVSQAGETGVQEPQPVAVGQEEWFALQLQQALEQEITQHWRVPAGLSKKLACSLAVTVDASGTVAKVTIAESSRVLAYDISARVAAQAMKLPKIAWGKEFVITFKQ